MDTFISTYQKDYVWPNKPPKDTRGESGAADVAKRACPQCGCRSSVCAPAVAEASTSDQPCQRLRKQLQEKYPLLFEVLEQLPPEEQMVRLYRERLAGYRPEKPPPQQSPAAEAAAPVVEAVPPPQDDSPRPCLPRRAATASKQKPAEEEKTEEKKETEELPSRIVTGRTEYQDGVGATGARIMNEKLLYKEENRGK